MRKILGVKEGRPKIPSSFAVMASVSNAKSLPKTCKNAKSMRFLRSESSDFPRKHSPGPHVSVS